MMKKEIDKKMATALLEGFYASTNQNYQSNVEQVRKTFDSDKSFIEYLCNNSGNKESIHELIAKANPLTRKDVSSLKGGLKFFGKFLIQEDFLDEKFFDGLKVNNDDVWKDARERTNSNDRPLISHDNYVRLINDINKYEELNKTFYLALLESIYEGVYCKNFSTLANLCKGDLDKKANCINVKINQDITKENETEEFTLDLGENKTLIRRLMFLCDLGEEEYWERRNRYSNFRVPASGIKKSSCFKIENKKIFEHTIVDMCRYLMKKSTMILHAYGYKRMNAQRLYISGIMYRIKRNINDTMVSSISEALEDNDNLVFRGIVEEELKRVHYDTTYFAFRDQVVSNADIFD
jgi:hypothetical protein